MSEFFKLIFKRVFRLQLEITDFLSTFVTACLGALSHYRSDLGIDMDVISWQIPLLFLILAFFLRIILAPYFIWKDAYLKCITLEARYDPPRSAAILLGKKSYSKTDKNALSDMFAELRLLLQRDICNVELQSQHLALDITQVTHLDLHVERAQDIRNAFCDFNTKLEDIGKKFLVYDHIFKNIVGANRPNKIMDMVNLMDRLREPLNGIQRLYAPAHDNANDISNILRVVSEDIREASAQINNWMAQTINMIDLVERELEAR